MMGQHKGHGGSTEEVHYQNKMNKQKTVFLARMITREESFSKLTAHIQFLKL